MMTTTIFSVKSVDYKESPDAEFTIVKTWEICVSVYV